jgi:hypothetical protein
MESYATIDPNLNPSKNASALGTDVYDNVDKATADLSKGAYDGVQADGDSYLDVNGTGPIYDLSTNTGPFADTDGSPIYDLAV